jgi:hypothetical protein
MVNLLSRLHIGDTVYSPIFGSGIIVCLDADELYCITVRTPYGADFEFDRYGRFALGGVKLLDINPVEAVLFKKA